MIVRPMWPPTILCPGSDLVTLFRTNIRRPGRRGAEFACAGCWSVPIRRDAKRRGGERDRLGAGDRCNLVVTALGYLPDFDEDVFISYAHNDDDVYAQEPWGWVTRLHQDLEQRVRNYLGSDIRFWRDCEIRNNEDFTSKIFRRLARTATLLSVLSPSFLQREWCR